MRSPSRAPRPRASSNRSAIRALRRLAPAVGLVASLALAAPAGATPVRTAVPIGAGYDEPTLERFATAAAAHDTNGEIRIVVLDIAYGLDAYTAGVAERRKNTKLADGRRAQIEDACRVVAPPAKTCNAILDDVQVRREAFEPYAVAPFGPSLSEADVDGMYVLGGDQDVGMLVVANTPLEAAMADAYANGAVISGNSAGAAVESTNMIAGYTGSDGPENGFERDSVLLWLNDGPNDGQRGLSFGLPGVLLDQHVAQRGRIARLVNASFTTGLLGIGVDASTAAAITNETTLTDVSGYSVAFVADPSTYGSTGTFGGPRDSLSIHHVATHVLAPGDGYDFAGRLPSTSGTPQAPPSIAGRTFGSAFDLPTGAGPLLLGGGLSRDRAGGVAQRFATLAGGASARIVVLAAGYARSTDAAAEAKAEATALAGIVGAPVPRFVLDSKTDDAAVTAAVAGATGVWLTAPDLSRVAAALAAQPAVLAAVHDRWAAGDALLLDDAAAAAIGPRMTADPTPPSTPAGLEAASSEDFLVDGVAIADGLGWLAGLAVEPRLLPDRHWGRLYQLLRDDPARPAVGIDVGTALELGAAATARGGSDVVVLDGRSAIVGTGTNGAVSAHWVVLDSYVDGEAIAP
jgi:cyanophycinase